MTSYFYRDSVRELVGVRRNVLHPGRAAPGFAEIVLIGGSRPGMAGKSGKWQDTADAMPGVWDPKNLRARLDEIVDRRNAIVHEGDYARLDRPQTARLIGISQAEATGAVDFLADLIDAIHAVS